MDSAQRQPQRQRVVVVAVLLLILTGSLAAPANISVGILYTIPVLMASRTRSRKYTEGVAIASSVLVLGAVMAGPQLRGPGTGAELVAGVIDGAAAILAVWAAALLGIRRGEAETELKAAREITATTLDTIADAVITMDSNDRVTFMNRAAEELTGWPREEALGRRVSQVFQLSKVRMVSDDSVVMEGPSLLSGEPRLLTSRDGRTTPVEPRSSVLKDEQGQPRGMVIVFHDVTQRQKYETAIKRLAYRDELTGLPNRTSFWDRLTLELAHAERDKTLLGLLYLDLDGFKAVNDTMGHQAGDELLRGVAERLRGAIRKGDTVARVGGDEFTVILPAIKRAEDAELVAEKLIEALNEPIDVKGTPVRTRPSIGFALYPHDALDADELVHYADQAMYEAKHGRR